MKRIRLGQPFLGLFLPTLALASLAAEGRGDGGMVRCSERAGPYQVTVFTAPSPLRAGPVDVSVLVQDAATGEPVPNTAVMIELTPEDRPASRARYPATHEAATNKILHAAPFELPASGRWLVEVDIDGPQGRARTRLELDAAEPLPRWVELWPWVALPALPVCLFFIHRVLARPKPRRTALPQ
jgi:hypothetical protein